MVKIHTADRLDEDVTFAFSIERGHKIRRLDELDIHIEAFFEALNVLENRIVIRRKIGI